MDENRLKHSIAVARKMMELARKKYKLSDEEISDCFLIGYNHDIGYEFSNNGVNHNEIGGEILKNNNFKFWKEIYYHGKLTSNYNSIYLDILNEADMQIDKYGNDVGFDNRLKDIESRYGKDSQVYINCVKLIDSIKGKIK